MPPPPWHFYILSWAGAAWFAAMAADYLMLRYGLGPYLAAVSEAREGFVVLMPDWVAFSWAVAIWSGALGAVTFLFRTGFGPLLFGISLVAMVVAGIGMTLFSRPTLQTAVGWEGAGLSLLTIPVVLVLWLYARHLHKERVVD
ncbi:hypothetical protein DXV76_09425 [Rhodobacteraceae bacterium CCMM004]|nr:hypothetical protein DXV76_09425 [Rhodobacteraceae bacterium CCMM004]